MRTCRKGRARGAARWRLGNRDYSLPARWICLNAACRAGRHWRRPRRRPCMIREVVATSSPARPGDRHGVAPERRLHTGLACPCASTPAGAGICASASPPSPAACGPGPAPTASAWSTCSPRSRPRAVHGGKPGRATIANVRHALKALRHEVGLASLALPRIATGVGGAGVGRGPARWSRIPRRPADPGAGVHDLPSRPGRGQGL